GAVLLGYPQEFDRRAGREAASGSIPGCCHLTVGARRRQLRPPAPCSARRKLASVRIEERVAARSYRSRPARQTTAEQRMGGALRMPDHWSGTMRSSTPWPPGIVCVATRSACLFPLGSSSEVVAAITRTGELPANKHTPPPSPDRERRSPAYGRRCR